MSEAPTPATSVCRLTLSAREARAWRRLQTVEARLERWARRDLAHASVSTARFGEGTPCFVVRAYKGERRVAMAAVRDDPVCPLWLAVLSLTMTEQDRAPAQAPRPANTDADREAWMERAKEEDDGA